MVVVVRLRSTTNNDEKTNDAKTDDQRRQTEREEDQQGLLFLSFVRGEFLCHQTMFLRIGHLFLVLIDQFIAIGGQFADQDDQLLFFSTRIDDEGVAQRQVQFDHRRQFQRKFANRQKTLTIEIEEIRPIRIEQFEGDVRLIGEIAIERRQSTDQRMFLHEALPRDEQIRFSRARIDQTRTEFVQIGHFDRQASVAGQRRSA